MRPEANMNRPEVTRFRPSHIDAMRNHPALDHFGDVETVVAHYQSGPAYSLVVADQVIACAGVIILWPGVGEAWLLSSPFISGYPVAFHRAVRLCLDRIIAEYRLHRIQAAVRWDFVDGHRWIKRLGFHQESVMPKYLPNKVTCYRYVRFHES